VDVGAAVGDTALLLLDRCNGRIKHLDCVEAEESFAALLRQNLAGTVGRVHEVVLSDRPGPVGALVRSQHQGTASAEGKDQIEATTLDTLFANERPDVIKVDTDGFDGRVLAGGRMLLETARPTVLFEWHPMMYCRVGNDPAQPFAVLRAAGYDRFVFFTKFGQFSHFGDAELDRLTDLCLHNKTLGDWHYDVAALPVGSPIDTVALADLRHWRASGWWS
jgi:FkbM family methyltransferase